MNKQKHVSVRSLAAVFGFMAASCMTLLSTSAHANLIVNGDFETGTLFPSTSSGAVGIASAAAYVAGAGATGSFPTGQFVAAFGGGDQPATGVITQDFATVAGGQYVLTFDYGNFGARGTGSQAIEVSLSNISANSTFNLHLIFVDPSGTSALGSVLSHNTLSFTVPTFIASGSLTTLSFRDVSQFTNSTDGFLDNVSLVGPELANAVPEPDSLLLLMTAIMGLAVGKRFLGRRA